MMLGAVIKNYFAQETGLAAADITNVSVMPCVRKQGEADREWFNTSGGCIAVLKARGIVWLCSQWVVRLNGTCRHAIWQLNRAHVEL
jgi:iron only hydrogenase large subunit-like protein